MKRLSIIPLAVLAVTPLTSVTAQEPPLVKVGDRARVSHDCTYRGTRQRCQEDRGTVDAVKADSIVLSAETDQSRMAILIASVTRVRVVRGRRGHLLAGVFVGAAVGAAAGLIAISPEGTCTGSGNYGALCGGVVAVSVGAGAAFGALVGALVRTERWVPVPLDQLRVSFAPQRDGRFGLGLSVQF